MTRPPAADAALEFCHDRVGLPLGRSSEAWTMPLRGYFRMVGDRRESIHV